MFGSAMALMIRSRSVRSYGTTSAPLRCRTSLRPSKRVISRPSKASNSFCSLGAIRSIRCWSSASFSVNELAWRMVVSASVDVAPALFHRAAQPRGRVVLHFVAHGLVHRPGERDRRGRPGIGAGSHRGDVRGFENEESGRCRAAPAGSHVGDHRHARGDDLLVHLRAWHPAARRECSGAAAPPRRSGWRPDPARAPEGRP